MDVFKTSLEDFFTGQGTATSTPASIVANGHGRTLYKGIRVKADKDNTGILYVGRQNIGATDGFPLAAGEEITIPVNHLEKVWIVGEGDFAWVAV